MKKILSYFFIAMCLYTTTVSAQTFQNVTGTRYNSERATCAATDADGNLLVAGNIFESDNYTPLLIKFNHDGSVNSRVTIPELRNDYFANAAGMEALYNANGEANGYIIVFDLISDVVVARFNKYSKIVWSKKLHSVNAGNGKVVQAAYIPVTKKLNGFYVTVEDGFAQILIKLSGEGDILWQKKIAYPSDNYAFSIQDVLADDDGGCLVAGSLELGARKPVLMKFSPSGRLLWGKRYDFFNSIDGAGITAMAATNGGYIFSGYETERNYYPNLTFKVNKSGDILWANNYFIPYNGNTPNRIVTDSIGNIMFAGPDLYDEIDTAHSSYIVKLDSMGNIIFGKRYANKTILNDITLAPGGYYAAGNTYFGRFSKKNTDIYVIKTSTSGNIGGSCTTSELNFSKTPTEYKNASNPEYEITDETLTATSIMLTAQKYLSSFPQNKCGTSQELLSETQEQPVLNNLSVSPNPTRGIVTAAYNSTITGTVQLNVYDKTGKLMFTKTEQAIKGKNTYQLNLSNLINGIYNLQIINGSEQSRVMFVIEK